MFHVHLSDVQRAGSPAPAADPAAVAGGDAAAATSPALTGADMPEVIGFAAGNPSVELMRGTVRMFRENGIPVPAAAGRSRTLFVVAVPSTITAGDWLRFCGPAAEAIEHQRIVRPLTGGGGHHHAGGPYCVIMRFASQEAADGFYRGFNGKQYTSFGPERCHVVYVAQVRLQPRSADAAGAAASTNSAATGAAASAPLLASDPLVAPATGSTAAAVVVEECAATTATTTSGGGGLTELPTCPVCLERLDPSTSGIISTACNHSFHGTCLSRWASHNCPVCRFTLGGDDDGGEGSGASDDDGATTCLACGARDSVWLCLICGFAGCGRFERSHALAHWRESGHAYALELRTQRVWSYAEDAYVHRLIASQTGGKLVELPDPRGGGAAVGGAGGSADAGRGCGAGPSCCEGDDASVMLLDKMEAVSFEYTLLLTSQLEAQRSYYEDLLARLLSCVPEDDPARRAAAEAVVYAHAVAAGGGGGGGGDDGGPPPAAPGSGAGSSGGGGGTRPAARRRKSSLALSSEEAAHQHQQQLAAQQQLIAALRSQVADLHGQVDGLAARVASLEGDLAAATARATSAEAARRSLVRQVEAAGDRAAHAEEELAFLRDVNDTLAANTAAWEARLARERVAADERAAAAAVRVADLEEQLRDLMFALDTQRRIEGAPEATRAELAGGTLVVAGTGSSPSSPSAAHGRRPARNGSSGGGGGAGDGGSSSSSSSSSSNGASANGTPDDDALPSLRGGGGGKKAAAGGKGKR